MTARMSPGFAVFNYHVNDAKDKARAIFIANFGQEKWDETIGPLEKSGIMAIFDQEPTTFTAFYITAVTLIVNGDVTADSGRPGQPAAVRVTSWELLHILAGNETVIAAEDGTRVAVRLYEPDELMAAQRAAAAELGGPDPGMTWQQAVALCQPADVEALLRTGGRS